MILDEHAFLTGICCTPWDRGLRRWFADWLIETEQDNAADRARFIRDGLTPRSTSTALRRTIIGTIPVSYTLAVEPPPAFEITDESIAVWQDAQLPDIAVLCVNGFIERIALNQWLFSQPRFTSQLFQTHPIVSVALTRQNPEIAPAGCELPEATPFNWLRAGETVGTWPQNAVIAPVWANLASTVLLKTKYTVLKLYPTAIDAYRDLSDSCVKWGRQLADLPELDGILNG